MCLCFQSLIEVALDILNIAITRDVDLSAHHIPAYYKNVILERNMALINSFTEWHFEEDFLLVSTYAMPLTDLYPSMVLHIQTNYRT